MFPRRSGATQCGQHIFPPREFLVQNLQVIQRQIKEDRAVQDIKEAHHNGEAPKVVLVQF